MKIESYINRGNSFPVIINDNDKKYFVKLSGGMSGKFALVSEWIGNHLGIQLGIKTQKPIWINLDDDLNYEDIYIEVKELIDKSKGLNIGFEYLEGAVEVGKEELEKLNKKITNDIFLLDLLMINIDRTSSNTNLMMVKDELLAVDYESSLLASELIEGRNLLNDKRILQCLRENPLYAEIDERQIEQFLEKANQCSFNEVINAIPVSLLNKDERKAIMDGVQKKIENGWFLKETIHKLKQLKIETKEAQKRRANKNQEAFKRKFNVNINKKHKSK